MLLPSINYVGLDIIFSAKSTPLFLCMKNANKFASFSSLEHLESRKKNLLIYILVHLYKKTKIKRIISTNVLLKAKC